MRQRTKKCTTCGAIKPFTEFYIRDKLTEARNNECKACHLLRNKRNKEARIKQQNAVSPVHARAISTVARLVGIDKNGRRIYA